MRKYRIFVQDRRDGLYSGLKDLRAATARHALNQGPSGLRAAGKLAAIAWPPKRTQDHEWLERYAPSR